MNFARWFILSLAFNLWVGLCISPAATPVSAGNPYQTIVERNVFGLVPIPTGPPPNAEPPPSLPKITPNGMMTIFGKLQVLFKVAVPGQPAGKEASYVMSEGDRQDDIEVQKIDEKSATITFNNHGTIQTLALAEGKATGGTPPPAANGAGGIPRLPNVPGRPPVPGAANPIAFGSHLGGGQNNAGIGAPQNSGASAGVNGQNQEPPMSLETQVIMMEANRLKAIQDNDPVAKIIPPTELTPETTGEGDGSETGASSPNLPNPGGP